MINCVDSVQLILTRQFNKRNLIFDRVKSAAAVESCRPASTAAAKWKNDHENDVKSMGCLAGNLSHPGEHLMPTEKLPGSDFK